MAVNLKIMQNAVANMVATAIYKRTENQKARQGIVRGSKVVIGNNVYTAIPGVDTYYANGDAVWCIITDSGRSAVVVGV